MRRERVIIACLVLYIHALIPLMTLNFNSIRAVLLDMDGVLWRGPEVLPGVPDFFAFLHQQQIQFGLATNNSTKTVDSYVERLNQIGVPARPENVITSSVATADYISHRYPIDTPVFIVGLDGIRQALAEKGYREDAHHAKLVVVGMDFAVTFDALKTAALLIRAGAAFIGTNGDRTFPTPEGLIPGNGSLLALLQTATDVAPVVIGKPEAEMFEVALQRFGTAPAETLMIGDRIETDILGAHRAGLLSALVLTGTTTAEEAAKYPVQADAVFEGLDTLLAAWAASLGESL